MYWSHDSRVPVVPKRTVIYQNIYKEAKIMNYNRSREFSRNSENIFEKPPTFNLILWNFLYSIVWRIMTRKEKYIYSVQTHFVFYILEPRLVESLDVNWWILWVNSIEHSKDTIPICSPKNLGNSGTNQNNPRHHISHCTSLQKLMCYLQRFELYFHNLGSEAGLP